MNENDKGWKILTAVILLSALAYSTLRAYLLSMTHDEALTYIYFAYFPKSYLELIRYYIPTTNHHLLNSVLIRFFTSHFGNSEFVIRLPALIGHALFLTGSYLTLKRFLRGSLLLVGACAITLHPFLIDYFSCARGYSLALGFMMLGFYFCFRHMESEDGRHAFLNTVFAFIALALSVTANLAFLNVFMATATIFVALELFRLAKTRQGLRGSAKRVFTHLAAAIIPSCVFLYALYAEPIRRLEKAKEFYHGGMKGFWLDTFASLIDASFYGRSYASPILITVLQILITGIVAASVIFLFSKLAKHEKFETKSRLLFFIVAELITCSLAIIAQNKILKTVYPIDRAVIYYIPIFTLLFLLLWQHISGAKNSSARSATNTFFFVALITALFHFFASANLTHFYLNSPDAHTKDMIETLIKRNEGKRLPPRSVHMGIHWWFEPAINYYILRKKIDWLEFVNRLGFDGRFDYYYIREDDKDVIKKYGLKVLKHYEISNTYLAAPST